MAIQAISNSNLSQVHGQYVVMNLPGLVHSIDRWCAQAEVAADPARLGDELILLNCAIDRLLVVSSRLAAAFAASGEAERQGALTPREWLRHNCNLAGRAATDQLNVGERLEHLPESALALGEGQIGFGHLALIARTQRALAESPTASPISEEPLLRSARGRSVDSFWYACVKLRHSADPTAVELEEADAGLSRRFQMSAVPGGMVALSGRLDPAGAATLRSALEPLARPEGEHDQRRRQQRLGDALVELSRHALDQGRLPSSGGARPHLQLTVGIDTLLGLAGAPAADLEYGDPISSRMVEQLSCDCNLTRILLDREGEVLEVGRTRRLVAPAQLRALRVRDGGCVWPGCDRPVAWTAVHHLKHWARGGTSDLPNLALVCHRHHTRIHQLGWRLLRDDAGSWVALPPVVEWYEGWQTGKRVAQRLSRFGWTDPPEPTPQSRPRPEPPVPIPF